MTRRKDGNMAKAKAADKEKAKKLAEKLLLKNEHQAKTDPAAFEKALKFCEGYKAFLDAGKTEREASATAVALLKKAGYKPWTPGAKPRAGAKLYVHHRGKAVIAFTLGTRPLEEGMRLSIAHIDSPRLDLKPNPLYEAEELALFKTHYYGGVRKYQWVATPLSMHGVVIKKDGKPVEIRLGEEPGEPVFTITDLLPHLSAEQNKRSLPEGVKGEELNILVGSLPFEDGDAKDAVKLETMRLLNEKYGITERDFARAELEFVPAFKASDIGFDKSLLGAYGQDDRVCAYTALMAELDTKAPAHTTICALADKEETGSDGNTGLASEFLFHFLEQLAEDQGANYRQAFAASECLSADVSAAFDPTWPEPFERRNAAFVNHGISLNKYTGARGKNSTSDASAEFMGKVTRLFEESGIAWQMSEMGKVDAGGGGTVAMFVANHNIDVVDVGVPVLSMHSPFEVTAKLDVYAAYKAFLAFNSQK